MPSENHNRISGIVVEHNEPFATGLVKDELETAIRDLLEESSFELVGRDLGPYRLFLATRDNRLAFHVLTVDGHPIVTHFISFGPFRRIIRDYAFICAAHSAAVSSVDRHRLQAIDMARRGIHNNAAELLRDRLSGKCRLNLETARRLFTLLAVPLMGDAGSGIN